MSVWDATYAYDFWHPVTAIREANPGASRTGQGDGNLDARGDPGWPRWARPQAT